MGTNAELFGDLGVCDLVHLFVFDVLNRVVIFWAFFCLFLRVMRSVEIYAKCFNFLMFELSMLSLVSVFGVLMIGVLSILDVDLEAGVSFSGF